MVVLGLKNEDGYTRLQTKICFHPFTWMTRRLVFDRRLLTLGSAVKRA